MQAGLSAPELGERADVTASAIYAIERGIRRKVTIQTARKLADALGEALNREASEVMWELTEA